MVKPDVEVAAPATRPPVTAADAAVLGDIDHLGVHHDGTLHDDGARGRHAVSDGFDGLAALKGGGGGATATAAHAAEGVIGVEESPGVESWAARGEGT